MVFGALQWLDLDSMKGSTIDSMSNAVDEAAIVLYGVSQLYKESANCRLEANYAHQQQVDLVPLMMEEGYAPNGWLGMLMGTRVYYSFHGSQHDDEPSFEHRIDMVVREIGDRGLAQTTAAAIASSATTSIAMGQQQQPISEAVPPAPAVAPVAPARTPNAAAMPTAPATAPAEHHSFSPSLLRQRQQLSSPAASMHADSMQMLHSMTDGGGGGGSGLDASMMSVMLQREERIREAAKAEMREALAEKTRELTPQVGLVSLAVCARARVCVWNLFCIRSDRAVPALDAETNPKHSCHSRRERPSLKRSSRHSKRGCTPCTRRSC